MYENRHSRPISRKQFVRRLSRNIFFAFIVLVFSLALGTAGYHELGHLSWIDSFYNSSMIIAGMGPANELGSGMAKLFASFYAIYCGVAFLSVSAMVLVPVFHRVLHKFHFKTDD
jgi:hypothetical protein